MGVKREESTSHNGETDMNVMAEAHKITRATVDASPVKLSYRSLFRAALIDLHKKAKAMQTPAQVITIGSKVMIRGDRRTAGKYTPDQLVDGKYVKRFGTNDPWIGVVRDINHWNGEALVGGGWRGLEMYELVQTENTQP